MGQLGSGERKDPASGVARILVFAVRASEEHGELEAEMLRPLDL